MSLKSFRIGTFNLYNLALPDVPYYNGQIYNQEDYARKKTWIAQQLIRMNADIVGFQEVFHEQALREALVKSCLYDGFEPIVAKPGGDGPVVALISRFPIIRYEVFEAFPTTAYLDIGNVVIPLKRFYRPVLSAQLAISERVECTVYVTHLKSKRPMLPREADRNDPVEKAKGQARSLILRATEAAALRMILMDTLQNRRHPVIVLGDINDSAAAVTSQIVSGEPPWENLSREQKRKIWDVVLYYCKDIQARKSNGDFYFTHIHNGHYESLDHIMVSEEFMVQNPNNIGRVKYVSLFNDHLIDETLGEERIPTWKSDHGQVVALIELR